MIRVPRFAAGMRFRPGAAIITAVVVVVLGIALAVVQNSLATEEGVRQTTVEAQILASGVAAALVFDDKHAAKEFVDALEVNPALEAAAVFEPNGTMLASFLRPGAKPIPAAVAPSSYVADGRITVTVPVMQDRMRAGTVYLRAIEEPASRRATRYGAILLLATMAAIVIVVLASAQAELGRANSELEQRAKALGDANRLLHAEMDERAKAEEALRQSQKMEAIGQLSGGIAHDFNNLLSIALGNLQLLRRRIAQGRTDVSSYVDMATEGLQRAATLTQRLLAFSRRQPLAPKPVDLTAVVRETMALVNHSVGAAIALETRLDSKWWTVCDINQMENLIINLAINARDAMPNGGTLTISTVDKHVEKSASGWDDLVPGDYIELRISDTGIGMNEEIRARAIDPFYTTKPIGKGTGLGLSMAFGYVRQSNGYMKIESEPGDGTDIVILMPRSDSIDHHAAAGEMRHAG